ncbi:hypothetical protein LINGRAPRIM_LOCUS3143 [Linum grandiflorum]
MEDKDKDGVSKETDEIGDLRGPEPTRWSKKGDAPISKKMLTHGVSKI